MEGLQKSFSIFLFLTTSSSLPGTKIGVGSWRPGLGRLATFTLVSFIFQLNKHYYYYSGSRRQTLPFFLKLALWDATCYRTPRAMEHLVKEPFLSQTPTFSLNEPLKASALKVPLNDKLLGRG